MFFNFQRRFSLLGYGNGRGGVGGGVGGWGGYTQVMLNFFLINIQYLLNKVFSFGKGLGDQNYSSFGSHYPIKSSPPLKFLIPFPTKAIWKILATKKSS